MKLLQATENYLISKVRLPVLKEEFFYPTEASVELPATAKDPAKVIGTCMRAAWYRYMGEFKGQAFSAYTHWIFLTGKSVEEGLTENWKQMGIWVDNNIKFRSKEHHVSGEIDCVVRDPATGDLILVEAKTYYGYEATKEICGNPKKGIPGQPKDSNLLQILIYLYLHKHIFTRGKLLYIDKVCQNNAEFDIQLSEENGRTYPVVNGIVQRRFAVEDIFARYNKLSLYVSEKEIPARDFELEYSAQKISDLWDKKEIAKTRYEAWKTKGTPIGDWNCRYCRYKEECYGPEKNLVAPSDDE